MVTLVFPVLFNKILFKKSKRTIGQFYRVAVKQNISLSKLKLYFKIKQTTSQNVYILTESLVGNQENLLSRCFGYTFFLLSTIYNNVSNLPYTLETPESKC